ncbi:MAG: MarR family transcriptional regulator [Gammaproteobacteria bacterium]|jgi:DNA-binding MarR family transcriptional regulator
MARKRTEDTALATAFEFFNEIGIIGQLASNQMQRTMPFGLTQSQFSVLNWFVRVDDQATPGRLARAFQVTRGAMTNTLGKLEGKGFIHVKPDPTSGRSKIVTLTSAGRRARDQAIAAADEALGEFLQQFPSRMLQRSLPLLREVRAWLDAARE